MLNFHLARKNLYGSFTCLKSAFGNVKIGFWTSNMQEDNLRNFQQTLNSCNSAAN